MSKSFKPVVQTDSTGQWYDNALRFATHAEAYASASALAGRWLLVRNFDAIESDDEITHVLTKTDEGPWVMTDYKKQIEIIS